MAKKITKKECFKLLRSIVSMLDTMCPYYSTFFPDTKKWFCECYKQAAHYSLAYDFKLVYPFIISLYNDVNKVYLNS